MNFTYTKEKHFKNLIERCYSVSKFNITQTELYTIKERCDKSYPNGNISYNAMKNILKELGMLNRIMKGETEIIRRIINDEPQIELTDNDKQQILEMCLSNNSTRFMESQVINAYKKLYQK